MQRYVVYCGSTVMVVINYLDQRDAFVTQLVQHSSHGRLHSQDAILPSSLKERENISNSTGALDRSSQDPWTDVETNDPNTMMTLPEFVKSHPGPSRKPPSPVVLSHPSTPRLLKKSSKLGLQGLQGRGRSNSAPPLAWLTGRTTAPRSPLAPQILPPHGEHLIFLGTTSS
jgi:hypothetical protein